jgi:hypothetical protein
MNIFSNKKVIVLFVLMTAMNIYAAPHPPEPTPPPPPGFSIDAGIFILICCSILFGFYRLRKYTHHKKNPA